jgi:RNA polymerase sigma-70 factor (ECF subfamily)
MSDGEANIDQLAHDGLSLRDEEEGPSSAAVPRYASVEAVFRASYNPLVRALAALAGTAAAEDAVQEAFVQLYARWGTIREYENPATWVRRVAINRLTDHRRSLSRRAVALISLGSPEPTIVPSAAPERLDLADALRRLPPRQRLAVALFYLADLPVREVAVAMKISEGAVNRHLHDGRDALRGFLEV